MNTCSPDFLCIAYTLVCESQFVGDFIRMRVTYTAICKPHFAVYFALIRLP